jgi:hypothetical protein
MFCFPTEKLPQGPAINKRNAVMRVVRVERVYALTTACQLVAG